MTNEVLVHMAKSGDDSALEALFKNCEGLLLDTVLKFSNVGDVEDRESICRVELYKAYLDYNPSKENKFSTAAVTYMRNRLLAEHSRLKAEKRSARIVSLDQEVKTYGRKERVAIEESLIDRLSEKYFENIEHQEILHPIIYMFLKYASVVERRIFELVLLEDRTQKEAGEICGFNKKYANRITKRVLEKLKQIASEISLTEETISA